MSGAQATSRSVARVIRPGHPAKRDKEVSDTTRSRYARCPGLMTRATRGSSCTYFHRRHKDTRNHSEELVASLCSPCFSGFSSCEEEVERANEVVAQVAAVNYRVKHSMLEKKFRALEAFWQFLPDSLFDYAWAGEAN